MPLGRGPCKRDLTLGLGWSGWDTATAVWPLPPASWNRTGGHRTGSQCLPDKVVPPLSDHEWILCRQEGGQGWEGVGQQFRALVMTKLGAPHATCMETYTRHATCSIRGRYWGSEKAIRKLRITICEGLGSLGSQSSQSLHAWLLGMRWTLQAVPRMWVTQHKLHCRPERRLA